MLNQENYSDDDDDDDNSISAFENQIKQKGPGVDIDSQSFSSGEDIAMANYS